MSEKEKFQGLYYHGVLEGLEPTPSGEFEGKRFGASLKLNFSTLENITKVIGGTEVTTPAKRNFKVSIETTNEELSSLIAEWKLKLNKYLDIKLVPIKDSTFKMSRL